MRTATARGRSIRVLCAALVLCAAASAGAQTRVSIRLRGMSPRLAGIVADPITDAFLNPARVGAIPRTQFYAAKHPYDYFQRAFPGVVASSFATTLPSEAFPRAPQPFSYSYPVYEITVFVPGGSFSVEAFSDHNEGFDADAIGALEDIDPLRFNLSDDVRASLSTTTHLLATGAWSSARDTTARSVGIRGTVVFNEGERGNAYSWDNLYVSQDAVDLWGDYRFDRDEEDFKEFVAGVSAGLSRPGETVRDVVLGAGYVRREHTEQAESIDWNNDDIDGNGYRPGYGGFVDAYQTAADATTERTYQGPRLYGRLHADLSARSTLVLSAHWEELTGDGNAVSSRLDETFLPLSAVASSRAEIPYTYDGTERRYGVTATVGFADDVVPEVTLSGAVYGAFSRVNFAEDGAGEGMLTRSGITQVDTTYASSYRQRALLLNDAFTLSIPLAMEWRPLGFLALRVGLELYATHRIEESVIYRSADVAALGDFVPPDEIRDRVTDTYIQTFLSNGVSVYLADRLTIDLAGGTSSVELASFSYLSLRYRF